MIDPCIYKVYKQDLKVFIPDFGAIIYSEATDSIDFNDLLTFDDGKVVEEIKSRKKTSKKVAEKALKEHVDDLKGKLDAGKSHLIRGLGYLFKDEAGSYAIQKKKPDLQTIKEKKVEEEQSEEEIITSQQIESFEAEENTKEPDPETDPTHVDEFDSDDIKPDLIIGSELMDEENADFAEKQEDTFESEEQAYSYKPLLSEEDEDVQEYYKRKEEYDQDDKNRKPLFYSIAAIVIILLLAAATLYYFKFYSEDNISSTEMASMTSSNISQSDDNQIDNNSDQETIQESASEIRSDKEEQTISHEPVDEISSTSSSVQTAPHDKLYSLILGSFKVESNAHNYHAYLTNQGKDVSIFYRTGSFHFVGFEQISGKSNALKLLAVMREEEPTAWIIRNR